MSSCGCVPWWCNYFDNHLWCFNIHGIINILNNWWSGILYLIMFRKHILIHWKYYLRDMHSNRALLMGTHCHSLKTCWDIMHSRFALLIDIVYVFYFARFFCVYLIVNSKSSISSPLYDIQICVGTRNVLWFTLWELHVHSYFLNILLHFIQWISLFRLARLHWKQLFFLFF